MGYYMEQSESKFLLKNENKEEAIIAIKNLIGKETCGDHFAYVGDYSKLETLEEILIEWNWELLTDLNGDITSIYFIGEKYGDYELLFETISPYVEEGSYIEMNGEDFVKWRWIFNGKGCFKKYAMISW